MRSNYHKIAVLLFAALLLLVCGQKRSTSPTSVPNGGDRNTPQVTVLHPNGGQILAEEVNITWSAIDPDPGQTELLAVDLEYSGDGGEMWKAITQDQVNSGSYVWDIAQLPDGSDYLLRVTVTDTTGQSDSDSSDAVFSVENKIFLVGRTGKRWDITHAVKYYGMDPENFRYGLGPNAIRPINLPEMIWPGEPGYPTDGSTQRIIGTNIDDDARAYPTSVLSGHEVVNELIGGQYVSVIY